jgi:hypothetical protein
MNDKNSQKSDLPTTDSSMEKIKNLKLTKKLPESTARTVNRSEWHEFSAYLTQHLYHRSIQIKRSTSRQELEIAMAAAVKQWLDFLAAEQENERANPGHPQGEPAQPQQKPQPNEPVLEDSDFYKNQMRLLGEVGTGLWRLRQKMVKPGTDQPIEELRRPFRFFASIWDTLQEAGITIQDHTDAPFDAHLALKVLTYEPTPDITREKVLETIKPSIYYRQRCIQMGEVIVAIPIEVGSPAKSDPQQ